tara:strand:- start:1533 stop:2069 length:537 start_codon:yes stop_codon:yes gene_type:complete
MESKQLQKHEILEKSNLFVKDIKILKVVLHPLELFVLKKFVVNLTGRTIGKIYTDAMELIFYSNFQPELVKNFNLNELEESGYERRNISEKEIKKEMDNAPEKDFISITNLNNWMIAILKKYKIKYPSYDKFEYIVKDFVNSGVLKERENRSGKGIFYILNPNFYTIYKDKFREIAKL